MHADEVDIDESLVRKLVAKQFPQWADLAPTRIEPSGTDNALYRLGTDMVVRLPRTHGAVAGGVDKDAQWLPLLAPLLPVSIPVPVAKGAPADAYPWQWGVYPWLEGENPRSENIPDVEALTRDIIQFVDACSMSRCRAVHRPGAACRSQPRTIKRASLLTTSRA